jgi:hypothetical protein
MLDYTFFTCFCYHKNKIGSNTINLYRNPSIVAYLMFFGLNTNVDLACKRTEEGGSMLKFMTMQKHSQSGSFDSSLSPSVEIWVMLTRENIIV